MSLRIGELLDESVVVDEAEAFKARQHSAEYQIIQKGKTWDLSKINFEKLQEEFKQATYKNIEIADLRAFIAAQAGTDAEAERDAHRFCPAVAGDHRRLQRRRFIGGELLMKS